MWHLFVEDKDYSALAHFKFPSNTAQKREKEGEINLAERGRGASPSPVIIQDMLGRHQGKEKLCNILAKARLWVQITAKPLWSRGVQSFPGTQDRPQKTIWQKFSTQNLCRLVFGYHQIVMWRLAAVHIGILAPQKTVLGGRKRGGIFISLVLYSILDLRMWSAMFMTFLQHGNMGLWINKAFSTWITLRKVWYLCNKGVSHSWD